MKRNYWIIVTMVLGCFLTACVATGPGSKRSDPKLAAQYNMQAQKLENDGDLPAALEQYKLALTADPGNKTAMDNSTRLSENLKQLANERYKLGMKYHRQGKYGLARKEFLTALKFDPDHQGASTMLVSRQPEKTPDYIFHIVQPGESLSMIAKQYYNDYKRYEEIARFNQLADATRVKPGQRIMVPGVAGKSSTSPRQAKTEESDADYVIHTIGPGESISKIAGQYYGDYKLFHAIAQYNGMDDATRVSVGQEIKIPKLAGVPFNPPASAKKDSTPSPPQARQMAMEETSDTLLTEETTKDTPAENEQIMAYRDTGIELYNNRRYEDAIFELNKAIEASPNDEQTRSYLGLAYFEAGKHLFDNRDYDAARESFESAGHYNPSCTQCKSYIEKCKLGPLLAHRSKGIDDFNKSEYLSAIFELEEFLQERPNDGEIRVYLSKAYYQQALIDYNRGDFLTAKKEFDSALENDRNCQKCQAYINQSISSYKEAHYNKGIAYFGKEQLAESIVEWEMVYEVDPYYKEVDKNLKKARALMDKLEQIKKSQQ